MQGNKPYRVELTNLQGWIYTYDATARANQYKKTTVQISKLVRKELSFSHKIWKSMLTLGKPNENDCIPEEPKKDGLVQEAVLNDKNYQYLIRIEKYDDNRGNVFIVVLDQCTNVTLARLERQPN